MWANEAIFYHIYPFGLCGANDYNDFAKDIEHKIYKISEQIEHLKNLKITALYLGPIFESTSHGYDTKDYYTIDRRLGSNEDFQKVCQQLHQNDIKIVLDGVFNHVGRDFFAFQDVLKNKQNSQYTDWFFLNWELDNSYNDGFCYQDWEGCQNLIKLNLKNKEVQEHLFLAIKFWVDFFAIDGLRLDVAYCLDKSFIKELHKFCKSLKPDFWLLGEAVHGDYSKLANEEMLDSVTNYECYKGLYSSCNSKNMFEIAHSVTRQQNLYPHQHFYMFLDNHDVSRVASILKDKRDIIPLYSLMFTLPGIPSIYYGSEFALLGNKKDGDNILRPQLGYIEYSELTYSIQKLCDLNEKHKAFALGDYKEIKLTNFLYCFSRSYENEEILYIINIDEIETSLNYQSLDIKIPAKSAQIFANRELIFSTKG